MGRRCLFTAGGVKRRCSQRGDEAWGGGAEEEAAEDDVGAKAREDVPPDREPVLHERGARRGDQVDAGKEDPADEAAQHRGGEVERLQTCLGLVADVSQTAPEAGRWSALSTREVRRSWWPASMSRQRKHADVTTTLSIFERSDLRAYSSVTLLPPAETESVARRRASRRRTEPTSEQKTAVHSPHRSARRRFLPCRDCGRTSERSGEVGSGGRSRSGKGDSSAKVTPREPSAGSPRSSEASGQVDAPSKLGGKGSASGSSFQDPCSAGRESPLRPATPPLVPSRVM